MVKGTLNLRTAFYLGTIRKKFVRWGFLNFVPKIELGDLKFWGAKISLSPISPPILYSGIGKFLDPWGFRRHIFMARRKGLEFGVFDQTLPKTGSSARPCGPRLWSVANAPGANFSPPRRPPRAVGRAALDSDHAECFGECNNLCNGLVMEALFPTVFI